MTIKVLVTTREHRAWPARDGMAAGEAYSLICQDMSQPPENRMTENLSYRLKEDEIKNHWDKSMDKTITIVCRRIASNKSGRASIIGEIVPETTPTGK